MDNVSKDKAEGVAQVMAYFDRGASGLAKSIAGLVADPEATVSEARTQLQEIAPTLAYIDQPNHAMASSLFYCAINLAVYLKLRDQGIDAHAYGEAMLKHLETLPAPSASDDGDEAGGGGARDWRGPGTHPGEFVVENVAADENEFARGFNITSCGICYLFGQHDAMDLVPYMCASDDVMSDLGGQGLRRTGTIALGAHHCDFRFQPGGEPLRVAEQYPEKIKFVRS